MNDYVGPDGTGQYIDLIGVPGTPRVSVTEGMLEAYRADLANPAQPRLGPIPPHQAQRVARMLRRQPRNIARAILEQRRQQVGEGRFRQEAQAIQRAARELDTAAASGRPAPVVGAGDPASAVLGVPGSAPVASEADPVYGAVLARSGASHPDRRYRRQYGRQL